MKLPVQTLGKAILLVILISTTLSFAAIRVNSSPSAQLKALPPTGTVTVPNQFAVDINVTGVTDLFSWQIKLYYDPALLRFINCTLPPGHVFDGKPVSIGGPTNQSDAGGTYILYFVALQGDVARFSGDGILCKVYFEAQAAGTSALNLSEPYGDETFLWNYDLNTIDADVVNGSVITQGSDTRVPTEISINLDKNFIAIGDSVNISGAINVTVPEGTTIYIDYWTIGADVDWYPLVTVYTTSSNYAYVWAPSSSDNGTHRIRSRWDGDTNYKQASSEEETLTVVAPEAWLKIRPNSETLFQTNPKPLPSAAFLLNVTIENVTDLYRCGFNVTFDPAILEALNVTVPTDNVFGADPQLEYVIDNIQGIIHVSANSTATTGGFNGTGTLCQMAFRSIGYSILKSGQPFAQTFLRFDKTATDLRNSTEATIYVNYETDACRLEIYSALRAVSYITLQASTQVKVGSVANFTGQISPEGVGVHVNVTLTYNVTSQGDQEVLGVNETDDHSRFTFSWNANTIGVYVFNVSWAGDDTYKGASATKTVYVVQEVTAEAGPDYTLYYVIIGVVVVAVVVGVVVYLKKFRHTNQTPE
jgi:hypothetical protein